VRDDHRVHVRALTVAIRLLSASLALAGLDGCYGDCGGWEKAVAIELGIDTDLVALEPFPRYENGYVAVGAEGTVVVVTTSGEGMVKSVEVSTVSEATLRAASTSGSVWWVVGDEGTAAFSSDRGLSWTLIELGTSADLYAVIDIGSRVIVAGDDVVLIQAADGTWSEVPPPADAWGKLRAAHGAATRTYLVGHEGVIWSAEDPGGEWVAESVGVDADLVDVGPRSSDRWEQSIVVVGANGTLLIRDGDGWSRVETGVGVDLLGWSEGFALAADGRVFELGDGLELVPFDTFVGARALSAEHSGEMLVVGNAGMAGSKADIACGGRPFTVDRQLRRPTLHRDLEGSTAHELGPLAAQWADDGLHEHASIASFARFGLELLALGAPPQLVREVVTAAGDELRHARLCFDLARRLGGVGVRPGAMPIPRGALDRAGDPIATALGLFEEGCINESVAACEAADAAAATIDPEARAVLEIIAADERRHATSAWVALRWLIATYGEQVREPLRLRLEQRGGSLRVTDGTTTPRRAMIHRRVVAELIRPLARSLLDHTPSTRAGLG
jgi:hypothetical protein